MPKYKSEQSPILDALFDRCVDQLNAGAAAPDCLARYPAWAADLDPLLAMVAHLQEAGLPKQSTARQAVVGAQLRQAVLQRKNALGAQPKRASGWWHTWGLRGACALLMVVLLCGGTGLLARTSAPSDLLYPLKLRLEHAEEALTSDPAARLQLHIAAAHRRAEELQDSAVRDGQVSRRTLEELHTSVAAARGEIARLDPGQAAVVRDELVVQLDATLAMLDQAATWVSPADSSLLRSARDTTQALAVTVQGPPPAPAAPTASATPARAEGAPLRSPTASNTAVRTRTPLRPTAVRPTLTALPSVTATAWVLVPTHTPRRQAPRPSATSVEPTATLPQSSATIGATETSLPASPEPAFPTPTETPSSTPTSTTATPAGAPSPTTSLVRTPRPTATEEDQDDDTNGDDNGKQNE